jgi:hypothetical protein
VAETIVDRLSNDKSQYHRMAPQAQNEPNAEREAEQDAEQPIASHAHALQQRVEVKGGAPS